MPAFEHRIHSGKDPDWYTKVHPQRKNDEHMAGASGNPAHLVTMAPLIGDC